MGSQFETSPAATAVYIERMLAEMRSMSQGMNADFLAYLIEMAMIEAADISSGKTVPGEKANGADAVELARLYMVGELE